MKCPFCCEDITKETKKCKYCGGYVGRLTRIIYNFATPLVIGLIIGLFLFNLQQCIEERKQDNKIIVLLKKEFGQNNATLNNIKMLLTKDLDDLKNGKITITPLGYFSFDAWEQAKFSNSNFLIKAATKDFTKLTNCYFILRIIETKIKDRELYRIFNEGKGGFAQRMEALDKNILDNIEKIRPVFKQAQDYLYEIHHWKVSGGSFYTDSGLVVDIESVNTNKKK